MILFCEVDVLSEMIIFKSLQWLIIDVDFFSSIFSNIEDLRKDLVQNWYFRVLRIGDQEYFSDLVQNQNYFSRIFPRTIC